MTYFPLPVVLGDIPPAAPPGAPWWAHYLAIAAPALGLWLFSQGVDALNAVVKKRDADGVPTGPRLRFVLAVLNVMAGNMLKGKRVAAMKPPEAP
jgi:hypothetical protein